jgi:glyoxylase-like metal-dependent hydrolase (beta-lactamase superfamily II)
MKKIKAGVYIEGRFPGVTVGAICLPEGTILIDSPLRPADSQSWLEDLEKVGATRPSILINLDSHPDRSLGAREMRSPVMQHQQAAQDSRQRAAIFKSLKQESGSEWETLDGLGALRWQHAEILFEGENRLKLGNGDVVVIDAAGPGPGASWIDYREGKVLFVGDCVSKNEAPFLGNADIDAWQESLKRLLSKDFAGYKIIASRGGEIDSGDIQAMQVFLRDVKQRLNRLGARKAPYAEAGKLAEKLFEKYKYAAKNKKKFVLRLRQGLQNNYIAEFLPNQKVNY